MKKVRSLMLILFLCLACAQVPMFQPVSVEAAATKSGLKKENGKYYYYVKGTKVTNTWKTVNSKKYYFGSTGAAYAGTASAPKVQKIDGAYYAFDQYARALVSTTKVINTFKCSFSSTGMLTGVVKVSGKYYYWAGKNKALNVFKTVDQVISGKNYRYTYYFGGKNGAAVSGSVDSIYGVRNILLKKINGYTYGFSEKARRISGIWCVSGKLYSFAKNGKYDSAASTKLRNAAKYGANAKTLLDLLGTPKKKIQETGCMGGVDILYTYAHIQVSTNLNNGKETILGVSDYF